MTTSITIPDPLYASVESLAHRLNATENEVIARAVEKFIQENSPGLITTEINKFIDENGQPDFDVAIACAASNIIKKAEW